MAQKPIIASHLILTGYGHWLPNDPRGSGSSRIKKADLIDLGELHVGRKAIQPSKPELREFHRDAEARLSKPRIWFDEKLRKAIAVGFAGAAREHRYTIYAVAVLRNHAHLCVRRHRDTPIDFWQHLADAAKAALIEQFGDSDKQATIGGIALDHPVWSRRPYKVFLHSPADVRRVVRYIENNPCKEGLARQSFGFVTEYDGWPQR